MDIINKTKKPISIPLAAGKKLFLGPGKTGQVTPKTIERPIVAKMIEDGELEAVDGKFKSAPSTSGKSGAAPGSRHSGGSGAMRQSGDR